ncbi:amino acid ABC transporter permease [Azospirillum sp. TSH100]|nr:amino acid ABC transporter permease [Azospirillum sp. TSH100]QCG90000.1 amino acid ABC transporter permease [Azospirillum sp. TSH100]
MDGMTDGVAAAASGRQAGFRIKVAVVWGALALLLLAFFQSFDLKFALIAEKLPFLLGLRLTPGGFLQGAALTLLICLLSIALSIVIGALATVGRLSANPVAYGVATFYGSFFRGTPLMVQLLLLYLGLPQLGPVPAALPCGVLALSLNYGAYLSEIFRAGVQSVAPGQREAAMALGLTRRQIAWTVILPQATRFVIPPTGAQFVAMLKDSSLVSVTGLWEINFLAQSYGRSSYRYVEMLLTAAVVYWMLSLIFEHVQSRLEVRYGRAYQR